MSLYDHPGDRAAFGVTGGQKQHGSKHVSGHATAALVRHRRFTVGLVA